MPAPVTHNGSVWLSLGANRKEKKWINKEMEWGVLVAKLQKAYQSSETLKEYQKFTKEVQAEKKDVAGGFVGGVVQGGRRKKGKVPRRSLITLDLDYAPPGFFDAFGLYFDNAAVVHASHSHTEEKPRLRLIMPLSREVLADEYEAIARKVAGDLNIDYFDDTTFQPERLMYWPSTPKDVKYYCEVQDGPWIDADEVLGRYRTWKDSSQWPMSSRAKAIPNRLKKQQGDPLEKPGIIGAFCRTYTIAEAIEEYLPDIYDSTDDENRYTYMQGSAAKGLVVYEDKFAFSHHGTDPTSGKLCNAFDLVRIHLYGGQDETAEPGTPINRMPSYTQMKALALKSADVRKDAAETRLNEASEAFADMDEDEKEWLGVLKLDGNGNFLATSENVLVILANDPQLKDCFQYNSFEDKHVALRDLPWRDIAKSGEPLKDEDDACLQNYLEKNYNISNGTKVNNAFSEHMVKNSIHPVREYLSGLTWDGKERIDTLLIDYFGAEDSEYVRVVTRKAIVAAVTRVFKPGCKFDNVLTLVSDEGKNKSTFLEKLGTPWFSADFGSLDNPVRAMEQVQGSWIIEIAELAAIKKSDEEAVKQFLSKTEDRFRKAYGRRMSFCPRQCIFIATTNKKDFLKGGERHRRFWAVQLSINEPTKDVWIDLTAGEVRQIWAEAMVAYKKKETIHLPAEMEEEAVRVKDEHTEVDPREGAIFEYLNTRVPANWEKMNIPDRISFMSGAMDEQEGVMYMNKVCPQQIWVEVFHKKIVDATPYAVKFIREAMNKSKDWISQSVRISNYGIPKGWKRVKIPEKCNLWDDLM